ncbi:6-phosphogluconolactonase [Erwinia sp. OLTSP20]|uniref:6-phosphogluconolactonase n=1 Tax=unclassified Erwinia TaxID=2622719 RepID=UPI000C1757B6|nr:MULTISPECIES: 6-phosphogluconolactonase [unclassified Erwinia]PIJ48730.1 6-phosphogluconolactonase [Erwinia sp. OAMSP11]PIJ69355.1 6-phosphogluconolactonase [Erwinia sp. OLSSP12]PIJ79189.1 6-phosphogluconolactonase [Erwinia sp. OLCASP19]PIJ80715.1 6-phosphogluconolactonase [Erwinia sp. OLMTSP26]PIJ82865.1 6-phosphogluconolactonase [Erwinia sp. OLMDSP33]
MKQVVYTASPESHQIHAWQMDNAGALTLLQVVEAPGQVQPMVVNPNGNWLHVGVRPDFRVVTYAIDEQGKLSHEAEAPLPGSPTHISTDRHGRFLFCGSYNDACVSVSPMDSRGLPQAPSQVIGDLAGCHSANIDLANQTLFVPALKQDRICLFTLNDNGELTPAAQKQVDTVSGAGPRHMAFHPNRQYAYCINELDSSVNVWNLHNPHGKVERVQSVDMMPAGFSDTRWAADIHLTPDGRFLYACDRTASVIAIFSVSEEGSVLTLEGHQPTETQPRGFNIDHSGQFVVAAGQKSDHIEVYRIEPVRGLLQPLARYGVGKGPMWVVIHALK